jgi:hypothetical protein
MLIKSRYTKTFAKRKANERTIPAIHKRIGCLRATLESANFPNTKGASLRVHCVSSVASLEVRGPIARLPPLQRCNLTIRAP